MNNKIIKLSLVGLIGVNLFLILSGIVIPWIISTNKLPIMGITFMVTTILFVIISIIYWIVCKGIMK